METGSSMTQTATRRVLVGPVPIGGGAPVAVQTMTKVPTCEPARVLEQIESLLEITPSSLDIRSIALLRGMGLLEAFEEAAPIRCDIVRCGVPDEESALALKEIAARSAIPVVADIHFRPRFALMAVDAGVHKLRINPGNLGGPKPTREVADACAARGIPIRVGVNAGSLEKDLKPLFDEDPSAALVESALRNVAILEDGGFRDIVISIKEHSAALTVASYRLLAKRTDYPLHVGVTEAGVGMSAVINSTLGVGPLLQEGIGDTIRISLTEEPGLEVVIGRLICRMASAKSSR